MESSNGLFSTTMPAGWNVNRLQVQLHTSSIQPRQPTRDRGSGFGCSWAILNCAERGYMMHIRQVMVSTSICPVVASQVLRHPARLSPGGGASTILPKLPAHSVKGLQGIEQSFTCFAKGSTRGLFCDRRANLSIRMVHGARSQCRYHQMHMHISNSVFFGHM